MLDDKGIISGSRSTAPYQIPWYWLLTRVKVSSLDVFTERTPKGTAILPIFGSAEDAQAYLSDRRSSWKPRKTGRGELVSVLLGVCSQVRWVVLDPLPSMATEDALQLVGVSREGFLKLLLGRGRFCFEVKREGQRSGTPSQGLTSHAARKTTIEARGVL